MRFHHRRANLLLTAIFIAALLFFLCVVLVSTNRQDISLSLFSEHHLKAELAAESGINQALELMRSHSEWEQKVKANFGGRLGSGAEWSAEVKPYQLALGQTSSPYLEIVGTGKSGAVVSTRQLLVEEIRLADSIASKGLKPHLFGIATVNGAGENQLMMLGPSMKWSTLTTPERPLWDTFGCNGGPLSVLRDKDSSPPAPEAPALMDIKVMVDKVGFYSYDFGPANAEPFPRSDKLSTLTFEGNALIWRGRPQVATLAKVLQPTIDGDPQGKPRFQTANTLLGPISVDVSDHFGPIVEWYVLKKERLMSDQEFVYCPAIHYLFKGSHAKNIIVSEGQFDVNKGFHRPEAVASDSAILRFDLKRGSWSVLNDLISYRPGDDQFTIATGLRPDQSAMSLEDKNILAVSSGPQKPLIVASATGWTTAGSNRLEQPWGIMYKGAPRSLFRERSNEFAIEGLAALSKAFPAQIPATTAKVYSSTDKQWIDSTVVAEQAIDLSILANSALTTAAYDDLYTFGFLSYRSLDSLGQNLVDKPITPDPYRVSLLLHFDGQKWQALPQGLHSAIWDPQRYPSPNPSLVPISTQDGQNYFLSRPVGLAGYITNANLMRRYVPFSR